MVIKVRKKKELDVENLNSILALGSKILKVLFVVTILSCILIAAVLFDKFHVFRTILNILGVAAPFFIGFVVAWLLNPAVTYLNKKGVKRGLGSVFVFVMFLVILFLIIHESFTKLNSTGFDFNTVETKIYDTLESFGTDLTTKLPGIIIGGVSSVISSIWSVILGFIVGFYLLIDFDGMKKIFNIMPKKHKNTMRKLARDLDETCKDFVQGTLLISFIVFLITSILFAIVGMPSPMLFGLICGVTNIIPYIGPWVGGAIAAIVGFTVSPLVGILTIVICFISQQIDGIILQPIIMGKTMKLHPVTIMIGLLVFGYFFGVLGMIIATPCIACMKVIIMYIESKYRIKERIVNSELRSDE